MTRQKKNLKTVIVHYKNTDLILKMIQKDKISRVRVFLLLFTGIFVLLLPGDSDQISPPPPLTQIEFRVGNLK